MIRLMLKRLIGVIAAIGGGNLGAYLQRNADSKMLREAASHLGLSSEEFNRQILGKQESSKPVQGEAVKPQEPQSNEQSSELAIQMYGPELVIVNHSADSTITKFIMM